MVTSECSFSSWQRFNTNVAQVFFVTGLSKAQLSCIPHDHVHFSSLRESKTRNYSCSLFDNPNALRTDIYKKGTQVKTTSRALQQGIRRCFGNCTLRISRTPQQDSRSRRTDHSNIFGATVAFDYHPLLFCACIFYNGSMGIQKLHVSNHHVADSSVLSAQRLSQRIVCSLPAELHRLTEPRRLQVGEKELVL